MSGQAIRFVVVAAITVAIAAVLWWSRESAPEQDLISQPELEQSSQPVAGAPVAPAATNERRDWFPDLSDTQSALTTGDAATGDARRFDCSLEDAWERLDDDEEEARNRLLADTLSRSANAEDQLAAAIIGAFIGVDRRIDSLSMALAADPMHPLVLWQVADDCRRGRGGEYCTDPYVRANLETVLGGNGWYWVQVASFYYEQGMFDESLRATQRAASAPEFDDYFIDNVLLLERALGADSDRDYLNRVVGAMGYVAAMPADFLARECTQRAELDDEWLDGCTRLAERYERDGTTMMMQMIGLGMQEKLYAQSGLVAELRDVGVRKGELNELLGRVDADYELIQAVDPQINARYLDVWKSSGERAAFEYATTTVGQLLEDPDYDPCVYVPSE